MDQFLRLPREERHLYFVQTAERDTDEQGMREPRRISRRISVACRRDTQSTIFTVR